MIDGENDFQAFEQEQNAPPADPPADPAGDPADPPAGEDDGGAADPADPPAAPKAPKTAQERIDEITAARRTAEREAKYWRDVAEGRVKPQNQQERQAEEPKAPNPADFDFGEADPKYIAAVIDFRVDQGLDKVQARVAQNMHIQAGERAWEAKQDSARSKFDDYDAVVQTHDPVTGAPKWPCSREMAQAIRTSDVGGELAYHLASNPEEARRIAALDPFSQVRALGRIEATLDSEKAPPAKTTNAPKPPGNQARGAGGTFAPSPATEDFAAFEALANRKAG